MKILYLDCFSGISGDMLLGALIDAGADVSNLKAMLQTLECAGEFSLDIAPFSRQGVGGTRFDVIVNERHHHEHDHDHDHEHEHHHHHRKGFTAISELIAKSGLTQSVKDRAIAVFKNLAVAEAAVHGSTVEEVHFHEVGAVDSIVDICGACIALEQLGIERIVCSPVNLGGGSVACDHGILPVPAPATARLVQGIPCRTDSPRMGELTTPTGAALVKTLCDDFGTMPVCTPAAIGYGFGKRENGTLNALRAIVAQTNDAVTPESLSLLEANIDDMTGEELGFAAERMIAEGALDCYITQIIAKKGRPGVIISVLCAQKDEERFMRLLFLHTSTLGVRWHGVSRAALERSFKRVSTPYGEVGVKCAYGYGVKREKPEYEDCAALALKHGASLLQIERCAMNNHFEEEK